MGISVSRFAAAVAVAALAVTAAPVTPAAAPARAQGVAATPASVTASAEAQARRAYARTPLNFEANRGQVDREVKFLARGEGFDLFLTERGAVFDLRAPGSLEDGGPSAAAVVLAPVGADPAPRIVGRRHQQTSTSYFLGDDPHQWERAVVTFGRARYQDLYPGIDLVFRGDRTGAEYDFVVSPGSDPSRIRYRLRGADSLRLDKGALVATTAAGDFIHRAPIAFQWIDGQRRVVRSAFRLRHGVVTFAVGAYDPHRQLVIDPDTDIEYGTYLGGDEYDGANGIAVEDGDVYLTGYARSADFPTTTGAYDPTASSNSNVFVARLSPDGAGDADLVYSTYLGGSGNALYDDEGLAIDVEEGDIYLTGVTRSSDFPTTAGALDTSFGGETEGFFAKLSPDGAGAADLAYSTLLGGGDHESSRAIAVADGDAYLTGWTTSAGFPTTVGAYDTSIDGTEAFLVQISPDGGGTADLAYSTFLGGNGSAIGSGIALDAGDIWVTGSASGDFTTTAGAYDESAGEQGDAFVIRLSPDGAGSDDLVYSTVIGAEQADGAQGIALGGGDVYVTGVTRSGGWPTTPGAHDRSSSGSTDGFVARLSPDSAGAADLVYSTYLGSMDASESIAVDDGDVYVAGHSTIYDKYDDYFYGVVARLSPDGAGSSDLEHLTYLDETSANGIAVAGGVAYVTGWTDSYALATPGAYDTTHNDLPSDAFLLLMDTPDNTVYPDALIRRNGRPELGDDAYYTWDGQTAATRVRRNHERVFWITAQNDDNAADSFRITVEQLVSRRWRVRYYVGEQDVTDQMVAGDGYQTPSLAPGEEVQIRLTVLPRTRARVGSLNRVKFFVTSDAGESARTDRVRAEVRVRRG